MAALTDRQAARARLQKVMEGLLDRYIPADEAQPMKGQTFREFEDQADEFDHQLTGAFLEELAALSSAAEVERAGRCPHCGSPRVYLVKNGGRKTELQSKHGEHFVRCPMILDWGHAKSHLYDVAKAVHEHDPARQRRLGKQLETWLWHGQRDKVIDRLGELSQQAGEPQADDGPEHPRRLLAQNVGYFTRHHDHVDYPTYRAKGWPIGSGVVESGVKQFNHRVKGTDRFWSTAGSQAILALRALWLSEDDRWSRYWLYGRLERNAA